MFLFRCQSVLGYLSQELIGTNFNDFIHEDDRNELTDLWNRGKNLETNERKHHREEFDALVCRDRQIVTSGNYRFRTKDNGFITLQTIFEPFINPWTDDLEIIVARNKIR